MPRNQYDTTDNSDVTPINNISKFCSQGVFCPSCVRQNELQFALTFQCPAITNVPSPFLQLRGPAAALRGKCLHDLTTARHFKSFFVKCILLCTIKTEKFQLRGNNSVCAGGVQLLCGCAAYREHWRLTLRTARFNIQKFYMVLTLRQCVVCDPRTNSDFCLIQH